MYILMLSNMYPSEMNSSFGTFVRTSFEQLSLAGHKVEKEVINIKSSIFRHKIKLYFLFFLKSVFRIVFGGYDVVYVHYLTHSTIPLLVSRFLFRNRTEYIINIHGDDLLCRTKYNRFLGVFNAYLLKNCKNIVVPSEYFRQKVLTMHKGVEEAKVIVNYSGGVDRKTFYPKLVEKTVPKYDYTFSYISRIEDGKGWEECISAFSYVSSCNPDLNIVLNIYGDGVQKDELLSRIDSLANRSQIIYKGEISHREVADVMRDSDAFLFPTHRESLGLVLIEAMSCATPIICSNISPLNAILPKHYPFLFEAGNEVSLIDCIVDFLGTSSCELKSISNGIYKASSKFSSESVVEIYEKL